jgi:SET domain-containing protein
MQKTSSKVGSKQGKFASKLSGSRAGKAPAAKAASGKTTARKAKTATRSPKIAVRDSPIHGRGVYAARDIRVGERIVEYTGEIISWKEADRRPPSDPDDPHHTFLFSLDDGKRVIDANVGGNAARWINHSCAPNCETEETDSGRVFIEAMRDIRRGEELHYDYCLIIDEKITKKLKRQYQCLCGAPKCRGTMLAKKKKKKR